MVRLSHRNMILIGTKMSTVDLQSWAKRLNDSNNKPAYLFIADLISADVKNGKLQPRDRLPGLREVAEALQLNYTTIARAFTEAKNRGLIDSRPGAGSFIKGNIPNIKLSEHRHPEMTMNMPIEPTSRNLL
ncbi:MAG: GntR family transcriptional regulator, partial [Gammaproteobacteria bacterium]